MAANGVKRGGPDGGLQINERTRRGWRWSDQGPVQSAAVRCRRDEWYLARAVLSNDNPRPFADVIALFYADEREIGRRLLRLHRRPSTEEAAELLGWLHTPDDATHLRLCLPDAAVQSELRELVLRDVSERDPKCHPLANIPRWTTYAPPFPVTRVLLPGGLAALADCLGDVRVELLKTPASATALVKQAAGSAIVIDPMWFTTPGLTLADLERVAQRAWVLVDLGSLAAALRAAGAGDIRTVTHADRHGLMSARVAYADVPTRGFALEDAVPYATLDNQDRFAMRALRRSRAWRAYATEHAFATILAAETPMEDKIGGVLCAARPFSDGELLATDLPWLIAGRQGPLLTPTVLTHLLRAHLGLPVPDHRQYWNRWDDPAVIVRDIGDLARRYPPLRTVRWRSNDAGLAHLGLTIPPPGPVARHLLLHTGRIDARDTHDGLPPEPLMLLMKWLAREAREQTRWAQRHLADTQFTWACDTRDGLKYAANFDSAQSSATAVPELLYLRTGEPRPGVETLPADEGLYGDRAFDWLDTLVTRVRNWLERRPN